MAKINRLLQPGQVESAFSHLNENTFIGGIPGKITDINDPEKIGRVRVRCDLIDPSNDLPNNQKGWIPFLERRTINAAAGGEHTLVEPGTLVLLIPIAGDMTNLIIMGCLPNREDPPHPETDRSKGTYGSVTSGQVFEINNDQQSSQLKMWPNGVIKSVSSAGDVTHQTQDGARSQLTHDGNARIENQYAFTAITKDGTVTQKSKDGAILNLHQDGTVDITNKSRSHLRLDDIQAKMGGPMNEIASLMQEGAKALKGVLGQASGLLKQVKGLTGRLIPGQDQDQANTVIDQAQTLFQRLSTQLQSIPNAITALGKIVDQPSGALGAAISNQIDLAISHNLGGVTKTIATVLMKTIDETVGEISGEGLLKAVVDVIPLDWSGKDNPELAQTLKGLQTANASPSVQVQAVLDNFFPGGTQQISGLIDLDLHLVFSDLQFSIRDGILQYQRWTEARSKLRFFELTHPEQLPDEGFVAKEASERKKLEEQIRGLEALLPQAVKDLLGEDRVFSAIEEAFAQADLPQAIVHLMELIAREGVQQAVNHLSSNLENTKGVEHLDQTFKAIKQGNAAGIQSALGELKQIPGFPTDFKLDQIEGDIDEWLHKHGMDLINKSLESLESKLQPLITGGLEKITKLGNLIPPDTAKAVIRALPEMVEAYTSLMGAGGKLQVMATSAELLGPFSTNRIFAGISSAGIKTPHGTFGLGSGGASIFSQGAMLLRSAHLGENIAHGISLTPQGAALSAFFSATGWDDASHTPIPSATIGAVGNTVTMQSLTSNGDIHHRITVSPDGIFLNEFNVARLTDLYPRLDALELRLSSLESLSLSPVTP